MAYFEEQLWQSKHIDPKSTDFNKNTSRQGALACFCNDGIDINEEFEIIDATGAKISYPVCKYFLTQTKTATGLTNLASGISYFVVIISTILRMCFIKLVSCAGEKRYSSFATATMYSVLIVTFFNAGITYLLAPWSFREQG